jgi:hypothetical protein
MPDAGSGLGLLVKVRWAVGWRGGISGMRTEPFVCLGRLTSATCMTGAGDRWQLIVANGHSAGSRVRTGSRVPTTPSKANQKQFGILSIRVDHRLWTVFTFACVELEKSGFRGNHLQACKIAV